MGSCTTLEVQGQCADMKSVMQNLAPLLSAMTRVSALCKKMREKQGKGDKSSYSIDKYDPEWPKIGKKLLKDFQKNGLVFNLKLSEHVYGYSEDDFFSALAMEHPDIR